MDNTDIDPRVKRRKRDSADTRAERKRELDRIAQRATRERTKNRIADLEQRLASLESGDKNGEIAQLTKTIGELRNDNGKYQNALMKMRFAINEVLAESEATLRRDSTSTTSHSVCPIKDESTSGTIVADQTQNVDDYSVDGIVAPSVVQPLSNQDQRLQTFYQSTQYNAPNSEDFSNLDFNSVFSFFSFDTSPQFNMTPSPLTLQMPQTNEFVVADELKWKTSDDAFHQTLTNRTINGEFDAGILARAIFLGWECIGNAAVQPVYVALRQVDQRVFGKWTNRPQRLAVIYVCALAIRWRMNPTPENKSRVPPWFLPRPAQERIQHPLVIDFLIWPGLRERLVFEYEKYTATGDFSFAFVEYFHFFWPFTEDQITEYDQMSGIITGLSKTYTDYVYDLKNWTMLPEFFHRFPEMRADIGMWQDPTLQYQKLSWT